MCQLLGLTLWTFELLLGLIDGDASQHEHWVSLRQEFMFGVWGTWWGHICSIDQLRNSSWKLEALYRCVKAHPLTPSGLTYHCLGLHQPYIMEKGLETWMNQRLPSVVKGCPQ